MLAPVCRHGAGLGSVAGLYRELEVATSLSAYVAALGFYVQAVFPACVELATACTLGFFGLRFFH